MSRSFLSPFSERIQFVFQPDNRGVVGIVDELLAAYGSEGLKLTWEQGYCQVQTLADPQFASVSLPKSVFRALLARIAALCNEHCLDSVSPYGGQGVFKASDETAMQYRAEFANTIEQQWVVIQPGPE